MIAAARRPQNIQAVVSRGGRPDLAGSALPKVQAPVLLIVGGEDTVVIDLNEQALAQMQLEPEKRLMVVPGATHLFEEPGTLEQAAELARDWFQRYLTQPVHQEGTYGKGISRFRPERPRGSALPRPLANLDVGQLGNRSAVGMDAPV